MVGLKDIQILRAETQIRGTFQSDGYLPPFRGATLRGALGYHLRKVVCHNLKRNCQDCLLSQNCAYSTFFEGTASNNREIMRLYPKVPQPFTLVVEKQDTTEIHKGQSFEFGINLFGQSANLFPYIAYAFFQVGEQGLGKDRLNFEIERITQNGTVLYQNGSNFIKKPQSSHICAECTDNQAQVRLDFLTPVRIRKEGDTANGLAFGDIIRSAVRRLSVINYFYGSGRVLDHEYVNNLISISDGVEKSLDQTEYYSFDRYSGRQHRKMTLDGLCGNIAFKNVPPELVSVLRLTEKIGLGKALSFGFGRIKLSLS